MRFFVLCTPERSDLIPYIVGEVADDGLSEHDRRVSLAGGIAGERADISTRAELELSVAGRSALEAWDATDDSTFDRENRFLDEREDPGSSTDCAS